MANTTVTTLTAVLQMNNTKFKKGVKGSESVLKRFQKQVGAVGTAIAASFGIRAITRFTKASVEALDVQLKAEASLLTALDGRILVQQRLIEQAGKLQKTTLFGDEETIRAQALIAAFVSEEEAIRRVIPLVQDFAAAKSVQLSVAADLVSKTLGSSTNALTRYGISVEGAVGSTERLDSVVTGLGKAFGGQATAAADADVKLTQLANTWGDLQEAFATNINSGKGLLPWLARGATAGMEDIIKLLDNTDNSAVAQFGKFAGGLEGLPMDEQVTAMEARINSIKSNIEYYAGKYQNYDRLANESRGKEKKSYEESQEAILEIQTSNIDLLRVYEDQLKAIRAMAEEQGKVADVVLPEVKEVTDPVFKFGPMSVMENEQAFNNMFDVDGFTAFNNTLGQTTEKIDGILALEAEFQGFLDEMWDDFNDEMDNETFPNLDKVKQELSTVGFMVGTMLANQFTELGRAIGDSMKGAEDAFLNLGKIMAENIGNILILVGLKSKQWYLVAAGAAIQLGIGISDSMGNQATPNMTAVGSGAPMVNFEISGQNLQGTLDRQSGLRNVAT